MKKIVLVFLFFVSGFTYIFGQHPVSVASDTIVLTPAEIQLVEGKCPQPLTRGIGNENFDPRVINSEIEFKSFLYSDCYTMPPIDFSAKTLLYFPTTTSGCTAPDYIRTVKVAGNKVIYHVHMIKHGLCEMGIRNYDMIIIPKISKESKVDFQVSESLAKDK